MERRAPRRHRVHATSPRAWLDRERVRRYRGSQPGWSPERRAESSEQAAGRPAPYEWRSGVPRRRDVPQPEGSRFSGNGLRHASSVEDENPWRGGGSELLSNSATPNWRTSTCCGAATSAHTTVTARASADRVARGVARRRRCDWQVRGRRERDRSSSTRKRAAPESSELEGRDERVNPRQSRGSPRRGLTRSPERPSFWL